MAKRKQTSRPAEMLFADNQRDMFEKSYKEQLKEDKNRPVECLGLTFENDEKRREKLKDPEFRKEEVDEWVKSGGARRIKGNGEE